jgi:hypothetical protein
MARRRDGQAEQETEANAVQIDLRRQDFRQNGAAWIDRADHWQAAELRR